MLFWKILLAHVLTDFVFQPTPIGEVAGLKSLQDVVVEVLIGCPAPESVDRERVLKVLPLGRKKIEVRKGGLLGKTLFQPELGDQTDELVVANAIVTVYVP